MSSAAPQPAPASTAHPLIGHASAEAIVGYRRGVPVPAARFLAEVAATARALPQAGNVLNACGDRYRFAVVLCAAIVRGQLTLLPPTTTPNVVRAMREFAPDAYYVSDDPAASLELPRLDLESVVIADADVVPGAAVIPAQAATPFEVPAIDSRQAIACVFTSGSTGEPQPNFKTWGSMMLDVQSEARRFAVGPGHTVLGTVPPQHMYGFESTVLMPLASGAALTAERLYYPGDIDAALRRSPGRRILFTTPFHLRAWLEGDDVAQAETIVSATAPLSLDLARRAEQATGARLFEIYGCTESGQVATRRTTHESHWQAFDGVRLWNEGGQAMVAGGHVERPTPLHDVIETEGDGSRFVLLGRTSDMVNIAGKRNSLGYLNHQLTSIPGVADGAFFLPDESEPDGVTRLMAFAVAPGLDSAAILAALRSRIDPAFMPRPLVLVERLPRQLTGKLTRESLQALARKARGAAP